MYTTIDGADPQIVLERDREKVTEFIKGIPFDKTGSHNGNVPDLPGWTYWTASNCIAATYNDGPAQKEVDFTVPVISYWNSGEVTERTFIRWSQGKCGWCGEPDAYAQYGYCAYCGGS